MKLWRAMQESAQEVGEWRFPSANQAGKALLNIHVHY
jgi:hypothetical protein